MDYLEHVAAVVLLYAGLVASLNMLVGHAGIMNFAHAAFYGVGAYATAMLTAYAGWPWAAAAAAAVVCGGAMAFAIGLPTLRLAGDYFILAMFGLQLIVITLVLNLEDFTNGPFGIRGVPRPSVFGYTLRSGWQMLAAVAVAAGIVFLLVRLIVSSPFGARLHAVRDDETVAAALGIDVARTRITAFTIAGCLAGLMGAMEAFYFRFVDTSSFGIATMILLLAMAFVGGVRSPAGAIAGAAVLVGFPELFRFVGPAGFDLSRVQEALYGLLLVLLMMFRPQGIAGARLSGSSR